MKIGIDARFAVRNRRGIGNYSLELILNLADIDSENQYVLYVDRDDTEKALPIQPNFYIKKLTPANYLVWEQIALPLQAMNDRLDILHCLGNTAPIKISRRIKLISSILDVMFLKDYTELPQSYTSYQKLGRIYRKFVIPRIVRYLSKVITISYFSKNDIMHHLKALRDKDVAVTYLAANKSFKLCKNATLYERLKKQYAISDEFIFTLGATDPRKNTERIIRTFLELKAKHSIIEQLVISGLPNWKDTLFWGMVQRSKYKNDIIFLDFITEEDLVCLYNFAKVFLYPSLYEGFGLPPLEGMSCGVPVITSNITSIPEIVGDAAMLINPNDDEELKNALLLMLHNEKVRSDYIERGFNQVKKFSWRKMAMETLQIYMSLA
jgi:glycosyltransferase involved in cell wall biosynthesis